MNNGGSVISAATATRMVTVALWAAIVAGPALGVAALLNSDPPPTKVGPDVATVQRSAVGPGDFAIRYVTVWLEQSDGDGQELRKFYPDLPAPFPTAQVRRAARGLRLAAAWEVRPGYWSVTVAGQVVEHDGKAWRRTPDRFWRVGVLARGDAAAGGTASNGAVAGYVATGLPTEVAGPQQAELPELAYGPSVDGTPGPVGDSVERFLGLYLTGRPGLDRYLAPGARITSPRPAPYLDVRVLRLAAADQDGEIDLTSSEVPTDGTGLSVLATVQPFTDAGQAAPLSYALTLSSRAGRWEVAGLDPAPALATDRRSPTKAPGTQPQGGQ